MYMNAYEIELEKQDGTKVEASLRLNIAAQIKLKKKYHESTTQTIFGAIDDIERCVDVFDAALKWAGNTNEIKSGEELLDLMAANDMLGMVAKQQVLTSIGRVSGLFSEAEKAKIDARGEGMLDDAFGDDDEANEAGAEKNA